MHEILTTIVSNDAKYAWRVGGIILVITKEFIINKIYIHVCDTNTRDWFLNGHTAENWAFGGLFSRATRITSMNRYIFEHDISK